MQHVVGRPPEVDVLGEEGQEGGLLLPPHRVGPVQLDLGGAGVAALLACTGEGAAMGETKGAGEGARKGAAEGARKGVGEDQVKVTERGKMLVEVQVQVNVNMKVSVKVVIDVKVNKKVTIEVDVTWSDGDAEAQCLLLSSVQSVLGVTEGDQLVATRHLQHQLYCLNCNISEGFFRKIVKIHRIKKFK